MFVKGLQFVQQNTGQNYLTVSKIRCYNFNRTPVCVLLTMRGEIQMSNNLIELLKLILENDNPEQAVLNVAEIIFDYSKQHGLHQEEIAACQ